MKSLKERVARHASLPAKVTLHSGEFCSQLN